MIRKFVNRKKELDFLEKAYREEGSQVLILYGRRRVGKTEIIKQFCKNKAHIYFLADKRGTLINAKEFAARAAEYFDDVAPDVENFDDAFKYIVKRSEDARIIVAIDEFSYLVEKDDSIPSVFQKIVDEHLGENTYLILNGSSVSMMEKGALSYSSPLYGRRTGQWKITPLGFSDSWLFLPEYSIEEFIEAFSVVGNIPAYLIQFDDSMDVYKNIKNRILEKGTFLSEEVEFLLREELREPHVYMSIIGAIASGATRATQIASKCYIDAKDISKYLRVLQRLSLVQKITPVTERKPKTKKTIYQVSDNFFRFWFWFVYPNKSDIESGEADRVLLKIKSGLASYVGRTFEQVCKESLVQLNREGKLPFHFSKIGNWWGHYREDGIRKEIEVDNIALNEETKDMLIVECKWRDNVNAKTVLHKLKEKAKHIDWNREERREYYAIFAKSFEERSLKEVLSKRNVVVFDLKYMENLLK
ncbi:MAG: hypothetical protein A7316_08255 [Candidatus Altiarchaeales archaeon WOR_SM1_86-2]|nr:MAG: hypothetical protein A7316_08255 [Candidatus Altiarchaeales archaeon WOR_SM1_86-2]